MTDNLQLQTTRLSNANEGNLLDTAVADIENAMSVVFGITKDSPVSPVMSITSAGNVTMLGTLTLAGAPSAALHAATKKYVDDNAGVIDPYVCAVGDTSSDPFVQTLGPSATTDLSFNQNVRVELGSADQFDYASNPDRITCKSAGDYLIICSVDIDPLDFALGTRHTPYEWQLNLKVNGAEVIGSAAMGYNSNANIDPTTDGFSIMRTLALNDYIEIEMNNLNGGADDDLRCSDISLMIFKVG
jgi:hypothetical protein